MESNFLTANPILQVNNVLETVNFYKNKLGFNINILWENPSYGVVSRGNAILEFGEGRKDNVGSAICMIRVEDADIIYSEWKSKDIEFVGDFSERDYGSKDFRVKDNNGNILIVGHALENQNVMLQQGNVA